MGLSIFSFDLAALINKLSEMAVAPEISPADLPPPPPISPVESDAILTAADATTEEIIEDILLATTVSNAAISLISPDEILKRENAAAKPAVKTPATIKAPPLDEEYKKIIEQLIRSLQTSVVHAYQSADLINEHVSHKTVANFPRGNSFAPVEDAADRIADEKKRKEAKLRELQEELKKAMLKTVIR